MSDDFDDGYDLSKSNYLDDIRRQAVECLLVYFCDKTYWAGGDIPRCKLLRDEHVKVVLGMSMMDAFAVAYYLLERQTPDGVDTGVKGWETELCYEAYRECGRREIPKDKSGGILLVWLSVCHGIDFLPVLKRLAEIRAAFPETVEDVQPEDEEDAEAYE